MVKKKLVIKPQKYSGETTVISMRMPKTMLADIDRVAGATGRTACPESVPGRSAARTGGRLRPVPAAARTAVRPRTAGSGSLRRRGL